MKITFLGTGTSQGIPVIGSSHPVCLSTDSKDKRLRVSITISWGPYNYVIDCGPDFRQQMLQNPIPNLDGILFTHEHSDHTAGLDDIRAFSYRQGDIALYAHKIVKESLEKRFDYIFSKENRYPGAPTVSMREIVNNIPINLNGLQVIPIKADHNNVLVFGFRFHHFTYLTDVKSIDDIEIEKLKGTKVLVINALKHETHISHFNVSEALAFIEKVKPEKAYLTHISSLLGFHEEVAKTLPKNVYLAYDNLKISIPD